MTQQCAGLVSPGRNGTSWAASTIAMLIHFPDRTAFGDLDVVDRHSPTYARSSEAAENPVNLRPR